MEKSVDSKSTELSYNDKLPWVKPAARALKMLFQSDDSRWNPAQAGGPDATTADPS